MIQSTNAPQSPVADLRLRADNCLRICQLEMLKVKPNFDYVYDFAEQAFDAIGTLRIMDATVARTGGLES